MSAGARHLTVLGEFKPFGLIAKALDGKPAGNIADDDYDYFLFDPEVTRQRDGDDDGFDDMESSGNRSDQELFIRGNRIIWTIGSRVYRRFTSPSPVIMACWCRMGKKLEAILCVLHSDSLTMYNNSGEVVSVPLSRPVVSIWPLPFGLLLQLETETNSPPYGPFVPSSPLLGAFDTLRPKDIGSSPQLNLNFMTQLDSIIEGDGASLSSHLILKDPLEEPHSAYIEERGKLYLMKEFDERTIWTSDCIPLMASYNKGKMQHSLWVADLVNPNLEVKSSQLEEIPAEVVPRRISFRRIWQGKGAQAAASKFLTSLKEWNIWRIWLDSRVTQILETEYIVFLATDHDAVPIICFLLQDQKKLLSVRLQTVDFNNEILFDIKPDMSWSIPAIAAVPVIVTRPRVKVGSLPFVDIICLASENTVVLYSGNQSLCRYMLPPSLGRCEVSHNPDPLETAPIFTDVRIVGLAHAVGERFNVIANNGKIFRCALCRSPSSSLTNDCITAMAEGLNSGFYTYFISLLWGDIDSAYLAEADVGVESEWESFCTIINKLSRGSKFVSPIFPDSVAQSSWEFLINSTFQKNYSKLNFNTGISLKKSIDMTRFDSLESYKDSPQTRKISFCSELLMETLDSLHAVYETLKLDNLRKRDLSLLVSLLCNIAEFLGEESYIDQYIRDFPNLSKTFVKCRNFTSHKTSPSLFRWLENCLRYGYNSVNICELPPLICKDNCSVVSWSRKIVSFYSLLCGAEKLGKKLSNGVYCNVATGSSSTNEERTVLAMVGEKFGLQQLDLLPAGISLPLRHALDKCRETPPTDWPAAAYVLLGREDLALSCLAHSNKTKELEPQANMNLIYVSTPYMLHLHPVTISSSVSDTSELENSKLEDSDSADGSTIDGMEHIFSSNMQLRYGRDLRVNEVRRLLRSARPVAIQTPINPTASDQELQQAQLWQLAQRTTALPIGRAAFTLATTHTLLTEALTVPKLVLAGRLPAQQNATVNLDPNMRSIQELKSWPEFHNAVASGLRLAPIQGKMSRTWIIYNKPDEPDVIHAGLLFALGLHGHLRVLTITDIYQYYSQEHESTTVGLMLGLAASYRGTMHPAISKSLYVHIPSRHPSSFPELELPTLLQSAALLSVGLLYEGSAHPQTMQVLLGEIGRRSGGDNVLEREGYAVSAGFSLGLVALGRGEDALNFMDNFVDRLFQYVGGKESHSERSLILVPSTEEHSRSAGQVMDGIPINVDVTAPGAIIALGLMYLKTESSLLVSRLSIPCTHFDLQYVRPDFIMLRIIARNLIMWNRVHPSEDWIQSQIPEIVQNRVQGLGDEMGDFAEMDTEVFIQAYVNIVAGACISLGLRFAGTRDGNAQELLYKYAVYFLNEIKPVSVASGKNLPKGLVQYVDRCTLETCLYLIVLSLSVVMSGSGHLQTFSFLRFLRSRNSADGHVNYGTQLAVSLSIGFLFLGGGMRTFSTSNNSIAALLITLYPRLPTGPHDNRCHLQAFRHLYVLATEARWVQTVDVDTGLPVYAPLEVTVRETEHYAETSFCEVSPCILPERAILKSVRVCGPRYWSQVIELNPEEKSWWNAGDKNDPFNCGVIYIKRKVGACSYVDDPIGSQSLLSRAMHKVFGLTSQRECTPTNYDGSLPATAHQLVSTFSSDPSLIAFAQLCGDPSWNSRSDIDFQEFCLQVLFECVSKDRPSLLQVYLALYTTVGSMANQITKGTPNFGDTIFLSSLKLALAYNEAVLNGRLTTSRGSIVQSAFLGLLQNCIEELLSYSPALSDDFCKYLRSGSWPEGEDGNSSTVLSWYLQWYGVPAPSVVNTVAEKIRLLPTSSSIPLLSMLLPRTHINALVEIDKLCCSSSIDSPVQV